MAAFDLPHKKHAGIFFYLLLVGLAIFVYFMIAPYIGVMALALLHSIIVYPLYIRIHKKFKRGQRFSVIAALLISLLVIVIPILYLLTQLIFELVDLAVNLEFIFNPKGSQLEQMLVVVNNTLKQSPFEYEEITSDTVSVWLQGMVSPIVSFTTSSILIVGSYSFAFFTNFFLFIIMVYFLIPKLPEVREYLATISPLPDKIDKMYIDRAVSMLVSMVKGTFVIAFVQGTIGGITLAIFGTEYAFLLTFLMIVLSIVPVVGTSFVMIPAGIIMLFQGNIFGGIAVLLIQIFIISTIDNILRPILVSKDAELNPALLLLGVFGGISAFGFLGLFYGPVIMILFITILEVYLKHYRR